ncbi:FAD-binding oxidoreductase [Nocardioides sp. L-11A]|uniref:FAD-binding oxidoreductase n=1 Tax=Nocardioides sp. L-11A TaxID=3043848 RepID=UPI00249C44CA|nr:FAD-binding protein [Nocardioides sp. L-11A]
MPSTPDPGTADRTVPAGTPEYAEALSCFNTLTVHRPARVIAPTTDAEVVAAVARAREDGLRVGFQATGHGARMVDGGALISTRRLDRIAVDPERRTATVGAGVRWADLQAAAGEHGLTGAAGSTGQVGVVGYTVNGGLGLLSRTLGFAADRVRALTVVTGDGVLHRVDAESEPDLFWALRGGGGLGLVTELTFDLAPVPALHAGSYYYAIDDAPSVLAQWLDWARTAPGSVSTSVAVLNVPDRPGLPPAIAGRRVLHLRYAEVGPPGPDAVVVAGFAAPVLGGIGPMACTDTGRIHNEPDDRKPSQQDSLLLDDLDHAGIATFLDAAEAAGSSLIVSELRLMGGAMSAPPAVANAAPGRAARFNLFALGAAAPDPAERDRLGVDAALDRLVDTMAVYGAGATLPAFAGIDRGADRIRAAWSPAELRRLSIIRTTYDPDDTFAPGLRWSPLPAGPAGPSPAELSHPTR